MPKAISCRSVIINRFNKTKSQNIKENSLTPIKTNKNPPEHNRRNAYAKTSSFVFIFGKIRITIYEVEQL